MHTHGRRFGENGANRKLHFARLSDAGGSHRSLEMHSSRGGTQRNCPGSQLQRSVPVSAAMRSELSVANRGNSQGSHSSIGFRNEGESGSRRPIRRSNQTVCWRFTDDVARSEPELQALERLLSPCRPTLQMPRPEQVILPTPITARRFIPKGPDSTQTNHRHSAGYFAELSRIS